LIFATNIPTAIISNIIIIIIIIVISTKEILGLALHGLTGLSRLQAQWP